MNETHVTIVGNVITDPRQRRTTTGINATGFRVASNERRLDRSTGEWVDGEQLFVNVTCWRKLAIGAALSLAKGDPVVVTGRLFTKGYEHEGQRRWSVELDAQAIGPDLSRCTAEIRRTRHELGETRPAERPATEHEAELDVPQAVAVA